MVTSGYTNAAVLARFELLRLRGYDRPAPSADQIDRFTTALVTVCVLVGAAEPLAIASARAYATLPSLAD